MKPGSDRRVARLLLLGLLFLLPACAVIDELLCTHSVEEGGVIESSLFGVFPIAQHPPAQPGLVEGLLEQPPWTDEAFSQLPESTQLVIVEGWNAEHGGAQSPSVPWGSLLGIALSALGLGNPLLALSNAQGRKQVSTLVRYGSSWKDTWDAAKAVYLAKPVPAAPAPAA